MGKNTYSLWFIALEARLSQAFKDLPRVSQLLNEGKMLKSVWGPGRFSLFTSFPPIECIATAKGLKLELSCESLSRKGPSQSPQHSYLRLSQKWTVGSFPLNAVLDGVRGEVGLAPSL